jgi:ribosomal protein L34E
MRCAICGKRVRTITRMNAEKAVVTPIQHKNPQGVRCNGWLTPALEEPESNR